MIQYSYRESRYVRLANTMLRALRNARIPLFLHRKSNHIFTVWQHMVLLLVMIRQYEGKSYRLFSEWLVEAYYLRMFLQLSHIPHFTTLQKFTERVNGTILERIISSFIVLTNIRQIFVGVDSSGFKATHASQYYTERTELTRRRKYIKVSLGADVLKQIICTVKIRRTPARHDNIDFRPLITKVSEILPLSVVTADKGYDSEDNHVLVREELHAFSVIPARYEHVPIWKTHGRYREETIISVIKRLFGEHITSRLVRTQNRELSFRCIAYNMHRLTNLVIILMVSTEPYAVYLHMLKMMLQIYQQL